MNKTQSLQWESTEPQSLGSMSVKIEGQKETDLACSIK